MTKCRSDRSKRELHTANAESYYYIGIYKHTSAVGYNVTGINETRRFVHIFSENMILLILSRQTCNIIDYLTVNDVNGRDKFKLWRVRIRAELEKCLK